MNDLLQEHKKFILTYVVGALVFLILWLIVGAMFNGDIEKNRRNERRARRDAQVKLPAGVRLKDVEASRKEQEGKFDQLEASLARRPGPGFVLEGVSDPDLHYNSVVDRIRQDYVEKCAIRNIDVDENLGRPDSFPSTPAQFAWYLRGLGVVQQVLGLVLETDDLYEGAISRVERIEIVAPKKRRSRAALTRVFIQAYSVRFRIVGHPKAVGFMLEHLTQGRDDGQALVVQEAEIHSLDLPPGTIPRGRRGVDPADRERVEARLTLASIDVDREGKIAGKKKGIIR